MVRAHHTERFVAELGEDVFVGIRPARDEGQPVAKTAGRVLLREQERPSPQRIDEHRVGVLPQLREVRPVVLHVERDRKSTRLNSSHGYISYAVFCLKKKNRTKTDTATYISTCAD